MSSQQVVCGNTISDVTQATSTATGVTVASNQGIITCFTSTLAAVTSVSFTVTNPICNANSTVLVSIAGYSGTLGTNGSPAVYADTIANGSFVVKVYNAHASAALAGVLKVAYLIG